MGEATMTEFTEEKLAELRAVAERATKEEWEAHTDPGDRKTAPYCAVAVGETEVVIAKFEGGFFDAHHIATFDPPTVLALIAALEAKTAEVEELSGDYDTKAWQFARARDEAWFWHSRQGIEADRADKAERERDEARAGVCSECGGTTESCARSRIKCCPDCKHSDHTRELAYRAKTAEAALERVREHLTSEAKANDGTWPPGAVILHDEILALIRNETGAADE